MLGDRIRKRRTFLHMTQEELGRRLEIGKSSISEWEHGKRSPSIDDLAKIAQALSTTEEYLMGWAREPAPEGGVSLPHAALMPIQARRRVPVIGAIACGEPIFAPGDGCEQVEVEGDVACDCAMYCRGDSMIGARIHDGDIVFIRLQPDVEDGQIAAVAIDDEMTLKRVYKLRDLDDEGNIRLRVELRAENPRYAPIRLGFGGETRNAAITGRAVAVQFRV